MADSVKKRLRKAEVILTPDKTYNKSGYFFTEDQIKSLIKQGIKEYKENKSLFI